MAKLSGREPYILLYHPKIANFHFFSIYLHNQSPINVALPTYTAPVESFSKYPTMAPSHYLTESLDITCLLTRCFFYIIVIMLLTYIRICMCSIN